MLTMLAMSDTDLTQFIPIFANLHIPVAFLVPTPTGFKKSIMDATAPIRNLLKSSGLHDYSKQEQGENGKILIDTHLITHCGEIKTKTSVYRPKTKSGDPRLWIYKLSSYCAPCNLLALTVIDESLFVFNLSDKSIVDSLMTGGYCYDVLMYKFHKENMIANELLAKLRLIHQQGFLPSITCGDPGVGDTLENALGIRRNNLKTPDYKGIELKTTRLTRNGKKRSKTRITLFNRVPDTGMTYREIVEQYGKYQIPHNAQTPRFQLVDTLRCSRTNAYDLQLDVDSNADNINIQHVNNAGKSTFLSAWSISMLQEALAVKHHETFWIKATSKNVNNKEWFRYDKVIHTKNPNVSLLAPLVEIDKITVDLSAYFKENGQWRNHGMAFKIHPDDLSLLLGKTITYDL